MLCPHCGYKFNPYSGRCQNNHCPGPAPARTVDADALAQSIAIQEENRRKSEATMRELYAEAIEGGCRIADVPAQYRPTVAEHLKTVTNKGLFGVLSR